MKVFNSAISLLLFTGSASLAMPQLVIHEQAFTVTERTPASALGWHLSHSTGEASVSRMAFAPDQPIGGVAVEPSPAEAFDGGTSGIAFMYYGTAGVATAFMLWTPLDGVGDRPLPLPQDTPGLSFSWWYGTQSLAGNVRLAVRIGSDWFVQTNAFTTALSTATNQMHTRAEHALVPFNPSAGQWADLAFTPGTPFAATATFTARTGDLPPGEITAFGFYSYNPNDGNLLGTSIDSVRILMTPEVADGPVITLQPRSQTALEGESAAFMVAGLGTGDLSYQWYREGAPIEGANGATLALTDLSAADAGVYTVEVSDVNGVTLSEAAALTVLPADTRRLLIVAGQSNAVGAGTFGTDLEGLHVELQPDVPFFYHIAANGSAPPYTSDLEWVSLGPQFTGASNNPFYLDTTAPIGGFGPEILLGRTLADMPGMPPVAILKVAINGTAMGDAGDAAGQDWWKVGGLLHQRLLAQIDAAKAAYEDATGLHLVPDGLFWIQGESDSREGLASHANAYGTNLRNLISDLRERYSRPRMPVVVARIDPVVFMGNDFTAHAATVRAAQRAVGTELPATAWVNIDDLPRVGINGDQLHLSAAGQLRLGWRMARAYMRLLADAGVLADVSIGPSGQSVRRDLGEEVLHGVLGRAWEPTLSLDNSGDWSFAYERRSDLGRLDGFLEVSGDLQTWQHAGQATLAAVEPLAGGFERMHHVFSRTGSEPIFVRMKAADTRTLPELTFAEVRDLYARMVRGWAQNLNQAGTAWQTPENTFEAVTRKVFSLGAWFSRPGRAAVLTVDGDEVDLATPLIRALRHGTDPDHPNRWSRGTWQWDPIIVDAPLIGLAAWALHQGWLADPANLDAPWAQLSPADRSRINGFLSAMPSHHTYFNNWNLFISLNHISRKALAANGVGEFGGYGQAVINDKMRVIRNMHRGAGWHTDNVNNDVYDDYNSLVLLSFQMLQFILEPDTPEAETVLPASRGRGREDVLREVAEWVANQPWFFDDAGAHIEFGRSTAYKYARLLSVLLAYYLEHYHNAVPGGWNYGFSIFPEDRLSTGQLRALVRLHLNHYLRNEAVDPDTFRIGRGQTPDSGPQTDEPYIAAGSVYWAQHVFAVLWMLDEDDPLWTTPEEPLPAAKGDFERWMHVPEFLLRGRSETAGHVELINVGNWIPFISPDDYNRYINKYNKFSYSSRLGWATRSGTLLDQCLLLNNAIRLQAEGDYYRPTHWPEHAQGVARTVTDLDGRRVSTLIFFSGDAQIRVHRITGTPGYQLRDGGYALGRSASESPIVQTGADWVYLESSRGAVMLQRLFGFNEIQTMSGIGNHSRDPAWHVPFARTSSAAGSPFYAGVLTQGSAFPFDPGNVMDKIHSVEPLADGIRILFADGSELWAPFLP